MTDEGSPFAHLFREESKWIDNVTGEHIPTAGLVRMCPACSTPVELRRTGGGHDAPTVLQPGEFPGDRIPQHIHRQLAYGYVYPGHGAEWVRIPHRAVCPTKPAPDHLGLRDMWRTLAIRRRKTSPGTEAMNSGQP